MNKWIKAGGGNYILDGNGFYISYNPNPGGGTIFPGIGWGSDTGGAETALVKDGKFWILNGDWRAEYEVAAKVGFNACMHIYQSHKEKYDSSWSTDNNEL